MAEQTPVPDIRTGTGFDVHKFGDGSGPIMLAGVSVPHDRNLAAHSDGDVGLHALCDAIFGALADGDIGSHFPPSEARWKDAESGQFLAFAADRCAARGVTILNLDLTLICERPKIGPHREAMRERVARALLTRLRTGVWRERGHQGAVARQAVEAVWLVQTGQGGRQHHSSARYLPD